MPSIDKLLCESFNKIAREMFEKTKSANKLYLTAAVGGYIADTSDKGKTRSANQVLSVSFVGKARKERSVKNMTDQEYGKWLFDTDACYGNCYEYSCLTAFFARQASFTNVYLGTISDPGDHVFCVIGNAGDNSFQTCKTVSELKKVKSNAWVVDPWANTIAVLPEYPQAFLDKMKKWGNESKRIGLKTKAFSGWMEAHSPVYATNFLNAPLAFSFAG